MPAPPAVTELADTYPNPSNAVFKTGIAKFLNYVLPLLGATGNASDARAAMGLGVLSWRNRLINSNFQLNQRVVSGTVTLSAGQYGHDRWKAGASGCTYTFAASGLDTTLTITAGSLQQVVEGANVEGGAYVMTWTGTAQGKIAGGSYSASGVGATGVTANSTLTVEFNTGTLTRVQLESGSAASPWERRPVAVELLLAQRYYETGNARIDAVATAGSQQFLYQYGFKVSKRSVPTMAYGSNTATNITAPFDAIANDTSGFWWRCTSSAAGGLIWYGTWSANSEI